MKNHSLIKLLKTFTKEEIREFADFIDSPYFNKREAVKRLYSILIKYYPSFETEFISREKIFQSLFPQKHFNDSTFRVLISALNELALKFITQKYFETDRFNYGLIRLRSMLDRNILKGMDRIIDNALKEIEKSKIEASDRFLLQYNLYSIRITYLTDKYAGIFERFLEDTGVETGIEKLTNFFYIRVLRAYVLLLNLEIIYKKEFDTGLLEKAFVSIDAESIKHFPVIEIYYYLVKMLKESMNEDYYFKVKTILQKNIRQIAEDDLGEIFVNMQNFCSRMVSVGSPKFYREKFELYKKELKYKTYLISGKMSPVYFTTLAALGLKVNEHKWVKNFIEEYSSELAKESRDNTYCFALALYEFAKKNFDRSLDHLSVVKFEELYQKLEIKLLQMMIYYEMNYEEALLSSLEAFRHFLHNNKLIPTNKFNYYNNFYKAIRKLQTIRKSKDKFQIKIFREKYLKEDNFANKIWIIEKVNQI